MGTDPSKRAMIGLPEEMQHTPASNERAPTPASTNILVYKVYADGVFGLNLGSSSAQSVVLMAIVVLLTVIQFRWIERRVQY